MFYWGLWFVSWFDEASYFLYPFLVSYSVPHNLLYGLFWFFLAWEKFIWGVCYLSFTFVITAQKDSIIIHTRHIYTVFIFFFFKSSL